MIKIENFDNVNLSGITYGGYSGSKKGITFNNERWFLKYPKSTKSMDVQGLSYTTSPISEYIGSHIYSLLGFDTHETKIGISSGKLVVACRDFLDENEVIMDYNSIKNDYNPVIEKKIEELSSSSSRSGTNLEEVLIVMENNDYFKKVSELRDRFWDMFIVDAFISNNDRNDNNWGLILDRIDTTKVRIAPIYDNGASFYSKSSDERIESILNDEFKVKQVIYDSAISIFNKNGKNINPLKFIESMDNEECNKALIRVFPCINLNKIKELFDSIPEYYNDIHVLTKMQRELYYKSLEYKYNNVFKVVYDKLIKC